MPVIIDPRRHDAVIFDLDGVITDTASVHAATWTELFDTYLGQREPHDGEDHSPFTDEDYRRYVDGKPRYDGARDFLLSRGISLPWGSPADSDRAETVCGLGNRKQVLFTERLAAGVPAFDTTVALVRRLRRIGVGAGVFSSSRNCAAVLAAAGLGDLFTVRVDGMVAEELGLPGKPDPAMLIEAVTRLGARPGRCVVVEDAESGVAAGRSGGFALVIGIDRTPPGTGHAENLRRNGADVVVTDLGEVSVRTGDRRMSAVPDAMSAVGRADLLLAGRRPAVFFDFDGTLSDIVDDPGAATLVDGAAEALQALAAHCPVAILSGRDLADVRDRIGITGIWYAGSHGFELTAPDGSHHQNDTVAATVPVLAAAADQLYTQLQSVTGVVVEHKRFAVAVHYRNADRESVGGVTAAVHAAGEKFALRVTTGREVVELRPDVDWDKGRTLRWVLERVGDGTSDPWLPIYLGDDITDEDAFDAIRHDGIGVVVRHGDDGNRATTARFGLDNPAQVAEFTAILAHRIAVRGDGADQSWTFGYQGYDPATEQLREALCTVGNGYLATRGAAPECVAGVAHYPGTYGAGVYNRLTDRIAGVDIENESLVNLPNWLPLTFRIDGGPWFDVDDADLTDYRQHLDLRRAELIREFGFRDADGRNCTVRQRRFVAMHQPNMCALQTTVTAENWSGTLEFRSGVNGDVANTGVARYRDLSSVHLRTVHARELSADSLLVEAETVQSHLRVAVAARSTLWRDGDPVPGSYTFDLDGGHASHLIAVELTTGQAVTLDKTVSIFTGRDYAISEPALAAERYLSEAGRYADLLGGHAQAWAQLWEHVNMEWGPTSDDRDVEVRKVIRLHMLHLLQTVSGHTAEIDVGVPARGLHGEAYRGHIFWDELFVFSVLNLRLPRLTRSLLRYRYRRLPAARRAAREAGYVGAMFPWQSGSSGREESQTVHLNPQSGRWIPDVSIRALHIGLAIAYNEWQYYRVTGDLPYLIDYGAEMLVEVARFFASRAEIDETRDRYVIRGVIGPDEFHSGYPERPHQGVDNNAYTNVMAVWTIMRALEALELLPLRDRLGLLDSLGIPGAELARWDDVSRRMFVPFHDGVISQFEGYAALAELDWDGYRERYDNIQRLDRILEAEDDDVNRYRVSKQADVLMLFFLLSADELRTVFSRLGYPFSGSDIPKTVDYYLARTSDGSTLSAVVHTWVLARSRRHGIRESFRQVLDSDVEDVQGGTTSEGIHLAAMAGSIDLLQRCFTGLDVFADRLVVEPIWPEALGVLEFPIQYRGHRLYLRIHGSSVRVSADAGQAAPIMVESHGRLQQLAAGSSVEFAG